MSQAIATPAMPISAEATSSTGWIVALAAIGGTLVGAVLKTFGELIGRRDDAGAKFRADLLADVKGLREWNQLQQGQINKLQDSITSEQALRHELRGKLHTAENERDVARAELDIVQKAHDLLKQEHAHLVAEHTATREENARLRACTEIKPIVMATVAPVSPQPPIGGTP